MTACRQGALQLGFLQKNGPTKASYLSQTLRVPKAGAVLHRNGYDWFDREPLGVYKLSPR